MKYITVEIEVEVRKHEVDVGSLKALLRQHRAVSIKDLAAKLNKPETLVAHWFRSDKFFAIPDADIWFELKDMLGITTDEFDKQITEFEVKGGHYDMRNRINFDKIAPTLTIGCGNDLYLLER